MLIKPAKGEYKNKQYNALIQLIYVISNKKIKSISHAVRKTIFYWWR